MLNQYLIRTVLSLIVAIALLSGGAAMATNGSATETKVDSLEAARAVIEQANARQQAAELKELEKHLTPWEKQWGIKLLGIRLTMAGYALHMRYVVLDPELAAPILQRKLSPNPFAIVEKSGATLRVPRFQKIGAIRASVRTANMIKKNKHYLILFANPARHVKTGDKVTVVIGNFMAENLTVQ